ncbi:MAG: biotin/lipoyl-containing protein [Ignavibacteriales bacterium]
MRKFKITVNGKEYEVGVEEIRGEARPVSVTAAPAPQPVKAGPAKVEATRVEAPRAKSATPTAPAKNAGPQDGLVSAPMPGTVSEVLVREGDRVKKGQVLVMLEAMKMQNEIMAGHDGVVKSVHATKGASVNTGDPLVVVQPS